ERSVLGRSGTEGGLRNAGNGAWQIPSRFATQPRRGNSPEVRYVCRCKMGPVHGGTVIVAYARFRLFLAVTVSVSCGNPVTSPPDPKQVTFPGTAAVRVSPAGTGEWLLLFE